MPPRNSVLNKLAGVGLAALCFIAALAFPLAATASPATAPARPAAATPPAAPRLEVLAQTDSITPFEWTEEEMRQAQPYPMELLAPRPGVRPPEITPQETGVPGWAPSRAPDTGVVWPVLTNNPPFTTTPPGFAPSGNYTTTYVEDVADAIQFPYSAMGKVYFKMYGDTHACSAAVIGENAILTAGHCVNDGRGVFHSDWVFIPAFHGYSTPFAGPLVAAYAIAPTQFTFSNNPTNLDLRYDYAVVIIRPPAEAEGRTLRQMTGALGFAWNMPREQPWVALGYPMIYFDGIRPVVSYGVYTNASPGNYSGPPYPFGMGSAIKSGGSGGPWLLNLAAGQVGEANYLGGVNSYITATADIVYSPYLDDKAKRLWDCAQSSTPDALGCGVTLTQFSSSDTVAPGESLTYTLVLHNNDAITATNLTLTDTLPAGVTLAGAPQPGGVCNPGDGVVVCALAELAPGAGVTATLVVTAPATTGDIINTALIRSDWEFATDYKTQLSVSVAEPSAETDLALTLTANYAAAQVGAPFTYFLTLENFGALTATHIVLTDTLPAGVTLADAALPGGSCGETGGMVTCTLNTLAYDDDIVTATITVTAPMQVVALTNAAVVTADQPDAAPADNSASLNTRVDACWARINGTDYYPLQAALDAAQPGDVVKVAGTCTGVAQRPGPPGYNGLAANQIAYITQSLTLRGGYTVTNWDTADAAANPTTLDALGQGRAFLVAGNGVSVTLEGLRFTGGSAWKGGGGMVLGAGVTLRDTTFIGNQANIEGGGLYLFQSPQATLSHNTFSDNTLSNRGSGGGLALSQCPNASLSDNSFEANNQRNVSGGMPTGGGGLYLEQSDQALVRRNTFTHNQAAFGAPGGGILLRLSRQTTVSDNIFDSNQGNNGGGLSIQAYPYLLTNIPGFNFTPSAVISSNVFTHNTAAYGGGIHVSAGEVTLQGGRLISNSATANGGGIYLANGVITAADGCIVYNSDTAVYRVTGTLVITDTWWGAANGPFGAGPGGGDSVNAGVVYDPFKTAAPDGCPSRPPRLRLYFPIIFKH